jgi:predicted nucleotidyltransferase
MWQRIVCFGLLEPYHAPGGAGIIVLMNRHGIVIDKRQIAGFCRQHGIRSLRLFGSVLREDFGQDSDVDVLVEFLPGRAPGWIGFAGLALELERIIGRPVDLRTAADFSESIRRRVLSEAEVQYGA